MGGGGWWWLNWAVFSDPQSQNIHTTEHPNMDPLGQEKIWFIVIQQLYLKELALQPNLNKAMGKLILIPGAKIFSKKCQKMSIWFGQAI